MTDGTYELYWIAVDPAQHRHGVGHSLMTLAEYEVARQGGRLLVVETSSREDYHPTRKFYLGLGYRQAAAIPDYYAVGDGKVILTGKVKARSTQELAEQAALYFPEVTKVDNQLKAESDRGHGKGELRDEAADPTLEIAALAGQAQLKREFGRNITFWGGIDTHRVLPRGTPADVREEVRKRIADLAPGGGYVLGAVHNIQAEVPVENVLAMVAAAREFGRY